MKMLFGIQKYILLGLAVCFDGAFMIKEYLALDDARVLTKHEILHIKNVSKFSRKKTSDVEYEIETATKKFHLYLKMNNHMKDTHLQLMIDDDIATHEGQDCHYHGNFNNGEGDVILSSCNGGLSGTIFDHQDGSIYILKYKPDEKQQLMYKLNKEVINTTKCKHGASDADENQKDSNNQSKKRIKRTIRDIASRTKYVSMAIVADRKFFVERMKGNIQEAVNFVYEIVHHMDYAYRKANVRIALTHFKLFTTKDGFSHATLPDERLNLFTEYNRKVLVQDNGWNHDNAQLLLGDREYRGQIGLGQVGSLCYGLSQAISYTWSDNSALVAGTMAHEFGHNFGLYHSEPSCKCQNPPCVMSAYVNSAPVNGLTNCAVEKINERCNNGWCLCLLDKPTKIVGGPKCGNGFVEEGEECDCGQPKYCNDVCCNPYTCKLRSSFQCSEGECCEDCFFKRKGVLCREKVSECDVEERCDGRHGECPVNIYRQDYSSCANNQSYCQKGLCQLTLDEQCKTLWGKNAYHGGKDACITSSMTYKNMNGDEFGNCGMKENGKGLARCDRKDVQCGKVQCYGKNLPRFVKVGHSRKTTHYWDKHGKKCFSGVTNGGKDAGDITLAKDGTKCDDRKVCYQKKCINVEFLKNSLKNDHCTEKCGNFGICTNTGYCYCQPGYMCPNCIEKDPTNKLGLLCDSQPHSNYEPAKYNKVKCMNNCFNRGICNEEDGTCSCDPGYACPFCEEKDVSNLVGKECSKSYFHTPLYGMQVVHCDGISNNKVFPDHCIKSIDTQHGFDMIENYRTRIIWTMYEFSVNWLACKCAHKAKSLNYRYIAIQFYGECWATKRNEKDIVKLTNSTGCIDGQYNSPCENPICGGTAKSAFLYDIQNVRNYWMDFYR